MRDLSVSWRKKPEEESLKKQLKALINVYYSRPKHIQKMSSIYISKYVNSILIKNDKIKPDTMEYIQNYMGVPIGIDKKLKNFCIELRSLKKEQNEI